MKLSINKTLMSGLLAMSVLAGSLVGGTPAFAAGNNLILQSKTVANGASFTVTLNIDTDQQIAGAQATVNYDTTKLTYVPRSNAIVYNMGTPFFGEGQFNIAPAVNAVAGTVAVTATNGGAPNPSVTGAGTWVVLEFLAIAPNTTTALTLSPGVSFVANTVPAALPTTLVAGAITIGTPPLADLTVSAVSVALVAGTGTDEVLNPAQYNVSFQVNNVGTLAAPATSAWVVVDGGAPIVVATPVVAAGANSGILTAGPVTLSGSADAGVITAEATNAVLEINEANNAANFNFSFVYAVGQITDVNGNTVGTLSFTQPVVVNQGANMHIGPNSQNGTLNVKSNQSWTVTTEGLAPTVSGSSTDPLSGMMTKYFPATQQYDAYIKLHLPLHVVTIGGHLTPYLVGPGTFVTPTNADVALNGNPQTLAFGIPEGQVTSPDGLSTLGEDRTISFNQTLLASDPSLVGSAEYHIQVSFVAAATAW